MAWTSLSFSVGQVLTAAQMNNLQANFAALAAGDSGAPDLKLSAIQDFTIQSSGSQLISALSSWTPAAGIYFITTDTSHAYVEFEIYVSGSWRGYSTSSSLAFSCFICDGTNQRVQNTNGSIAITVYYHKFA